MNKRQATNNTERIISSVLQIGVIVSTAIILLGLISFFAHGNPRSTPYHHYASPAYSFPHSISAIRNSLHSDQGAGLIELGIGILILTPVLRVAASFILFLRQQDRPMSAITLSVLIVLICSFILGLTTH